MAMSQEALEFVLEEIFCDARFDSFMELISDGRIDVLVGDPGWSLERRCDEDAWPPGADFRAFVDPGEVHTTEPESFCTGGDLARTALRMLEARLSTSTEQLMQVRNQRRLTRTELTPLFRTLELMAQS